MKDIMDRVETEIRAWDRPENWINYQQFFKEELEEPVGLKTPVLRRISNQLYREEGKSLPKKEVLRICDEILASGHRYRCFFAFDWARKVAGQLESEDFSRLENWLSSAVDNWGACDHLSVSALGVLISRYPLLSNKRMRWARSTNRWERRAACVSLIPAVQKGLLLEHVLDTASIVQQDRDDMVQKGSGWMLKVAGASFPEEVREFVLCHKLRMPRTTLRYAIEKWPSDLRALAMAKT